MPSRSLAALAFALVCACGTSKAEQACLDTADAVAKAAERCGQDYQINYDDFIQSGASGDCANVKEIRDEGALRDHCLPTFETISCADFIAGNVDESCRSQLSATELRLESTGTLGAAFAAPNAR